MCNSFVWYAMMLLAVLPLRGEALPVKRGDGGEEWSEWGEWTQCSRSCGAGVSLQHRTCLLKNGTCTTDTQYRSCCIAACPPDAPSFREVQCAEFNIISHTGMEYNWVPHDSAVDTCQLICVGEDSSQLIVDAVHGTECLTETGKEHGVCLGRTCAKVGCDGILGSRKALDQCHRCVDRDDGACHKISGSYNGSSDAQVEKGYIKVVDIPEGVTTLTLNCTKQPHEKGLVIRSVHGDCYVLSEHTTGELDVFGMVVQYQLIEELSQDIQILKAQGPIIKDIAVKVHQQDSTTSVHYVYYQLGKAAHPTDHPTSPPHQPEHQDEDTMEGFVEWVYGEFSECSVSCGQGMQTSVAYCRDIDYPDRDFTDHFCAALSVPKPLPIQRICSMGACPPRWEAGEWEACSASCGGGYQERRVDCKQVQENGTDHVVDSKLCQKLKVLVKWQACKQRPCDPHWQEGEWGPCSTTCGSGVRQRNITCVDSSGKEVGTEFCEHLIKPSTTGHCNNSQPCCNWITQSWSQCTGVCGSAQIHRTVLCVCEIDGVLQQSVDTYCDSTSQPPHSQPCTLENCPEWHATDTWGECSTSCGPGLRHRNVTCELNGEIMTGCDPSMQPSSVLVCDNEPCCTPCADGCEDNSGVDCHLVLQLDLCKGYFYSEPCCATCSGCCAHNTA